VADKDQNFKNNSAKIIGEILSDYLRGEKSKGDEGKRKDFKSSSAEIVTDLLRDPRVRWGLKYLGGEEFKADRERIRREAGERLRNIRNSYRPKKRTPETAARERELSLELATVEAEAAELRLRLAELLEEEENLRKALEEL
jgi:hypothetical protein